MTIRCAPDGLYATSMVIALPFQVAVIEVMPVAPRTITLTTSSPLVRVPSVMGIVRVAESAVAWLISSSPVRAGVVKAIYGLHAAICASATHHAWASRSLPEDGYPRCPPQASEL